MFKLQPMTENESKELVLDSYVTYIHNHHCANCGCVETFSQCFEVWLHPTKTRTSNLRDLRPINGPLKQLSMAVLKTGPKSVPVCTSCVTANTVSRATVTPTTDAAWQDTLRRKYAPTPAATEPKVARATAPAKVVPSLDQI